MKKMMICVAISALMAQLGCWAMEGDRQQIPELEQSLEWRPTRKIEEVTANNRLIIDNKAMGWRSPWRLHIKWYVRNHRAPRGYEEFDQILEYGERLLLGPISQVIAVLYAAHGKLWGKTSWEYKAIPRWVLEGWQIESGPGKDIIATITTDRTGLFFQAQHTFEKRPEKAGFQAGPSTGKLLDAFPTVKVKVLEKITAEELSRMRPDQIEEVLKRLQEVGFIQPRHFLGLPDGVNDRKVVENVFGRRLQQLQDLKRLEPWQAEFIDKKVIDYLQRAYNKLMGL